MDLLPKVVHRRGCDLLVCFIWDCCGIIHFINWGGRIEQILISNHVLMYTEIRTPKHFHLGLLYRLYILYTRYLPSNIHNGHRSQSRRHWVVGILIYTTTYITTHLATRLATHLVTYTVRSTHSVSISVESAVIQIKEFLGTYFRFNNFNNSIFLKFVLWRKKINWHNIIMSNCILYFVLNFQIKKKQVHSVLTHLADKPLYRGGGLQVSFWSSSMLDVQWIPVSLSWQVSITKIYEDLEAETGLSWIYW